MNFLKLNVIVLFFLSPFSMASDQIIIGCQGEGCDCFRNSDLTKSGYGVLLKTIRPFALFKAKNENSKKIGQFESGIMAIPLKQEIVVSTQGKYRVESVSSTSLEIKPGDNLHTIINLGEGSYKFRQGANWYVAESDELTLKEIEPTKLAEWMQVKVKKTTGYTKDQPFEHCLE